MMQQGGQFYQYIKIQQKIVKKEIYLFYEQTNGIGTLYWDERSRRSLSSNRRLPLSSITDIYLGRQTTILKSQVASTANDGLCFSLLSSNLMLDLEAINTEQLVCWLFGIVSAMTETGKKVTEKSEKDDNTDIEVTNDELEVLKQTVMTDEIRRHHSRKFSIINTNFHSFSSCDSIDEEEIKKEEIRPPMIIHVPRTPATPRAMERLTEEEKDREKYNGISHLLNNQSNHLKIVEQGKQIQNY
jgi:hypothetical protein